MCYCPTPTLHLNLALTGDGAFLFSLKKAHSVWFISVLNYGDTENVLINHLLLVIPMSYPCHYTNLCPHKPHKHAHTHTHTHTHFCEKWGHTIGIRVFMLYELYVLLPYTNPTHKLSPYRRLRISTSPPKISLCMIYKHFESGDMEQCPEKSPSPCNTCVIPVSLYKCMSSFGSHACMHARTHARTHTHTKIYIYINLICIWCSILC